METIEFCSFYYTNVHDLQLKLKINIFYVFLSCFFCISVFILCENSTLRLSEISDCHVLNVVLNLMLNVLLNMVPISQWLF